MKKCEQKMVGPAAAVKEMIFILAHSVTHTKVIYRALGHIEVVCTWLGRMPKVN